MDFKRTQILLLVFFIFFDAYLAFTLITKQQVRQTNRAEVTNVSIETQLKNRNIKINQTLSNESYQLPIVKAETSQVLEKERGTLQGQTARYNNGVLQSTFDQALDLGLGLDRDSKTLTQEQVEAIRHNFLDRPEYFVRGAEYTVWSYSPESRTLTFYMVAYDGYPVVDGTSELRLSFNADFQLREYTQTYQSDFKVLDQPISLISIKDALKLLEKRVDTYIPDGSTIQQISLGYYRTVNLQEFDVYTPVWEITYSQDEASTRTVLVDAVEHQVVTKPNTNVTSP